MGTGEVSKLIHAFFEKQNVDNALQGGLTRSNRGQTPETSAKLATEVMHYIGENAFMELRSHAREYQEGRISVKALYSRAFELCGGEIDAFLRLAAYLPDADRRAEILRFHKAAQVEDLQ